MKPLLRICAVLALVLSAISTSRAFTHPGIPFTVADLDAQKANLGVEPWKSGYADLTGDGRSQLTYAMRGPFATVSRTGILGGGDDPGASEYENDMQAVYNLARMWYFTGNTAYAQKAHDILLAWATTHTGWGGAEPYLTEGDAAPSLFGGADILRGTWPGWTQADTDTCKTYFGNVYANQGTINPLRSANQGALQLSPNLGAAVFCDDQEKFDQCLQAYRADPVGGLANSLPNGQVGDSGRDQGHAGGQIFNLTWMAEVFWKQGVDVYGELDNRLLAIGEFYSRYNYGAATPYIPFGTKYDYYWKGHGGLPKSSERGPDILNMLHSAYVTRKGMSAPWISLYRANRPENSETFGYRKVADTSTAVRPAALAVAAPVAAAIAGDLTDVEIGTATPVGSSSYANGTWTVTGGGANISGTADSHHFVYKQLTGDFTMIANVTSLQAASANAKAGLVVRDALVNASRRVYFGYVPGSAAPLVETQLRGYTADSHNDPDEFTHDGPASMLPQWLKIQRIGTRISYFHCSDGINWVPLQNAEYAGWTDTTYVGLAVCSAVNGTSATATFANVSITGGSGVETITAPTAPLAVYAAPGNRQVPLRWMPVRGATTYDVKRATTSGGPYTTIATVVGTNYTDNALTNGSTYYYAVSAANSAGESADSPSDYVTPLPPIFRVEAESYSTQGGIQTENCSEGGRNLSYIGNNDWTQYTAVDFGSGAMTFQARVANLSTANASIEVRLDSAAGPLVGTIPVPVTGGSQTWTTSTIPLTGVTGVHNVHLKFITGGFNLNWFEYQRLDAPAPVAGAATPAGLTATAGVTTARVNLAWPAAGGASSYRVKRATTSGGAYTVIAENYLGTTMTDSTVAPSTFYYYAVSALNAGGESANTPQAAATTPGLLPATWGSTDIGLVGLEGGAAYTAGTFTVQGSGSDIQGTADSFRYVYQQLTGDGAIVARVASLTSGDQWAKSGVMLRESLAADSINVCMIVSRSNGVSWQRRTATAGGTTVSTTGGITAPEWVLLQRVGDTFTAYTSADGIDWIQRGSQNITMAPTLYVGLAVCARNNTQLNTSTFDDVRLGPPLPISPAPSVATVGSGLVSLTWPAVANATSYNVKRASVSGGAYATISSVTGTACTDTGLTNGTRYYYVVSAVNATGESSDSGQLSATPGVIGGSGGFLSGDIGTMTVAGSSSYSNGVYTVTGAGDIWNASDTLRYTYQAITGDATIVARVVSQTAGKAGVMIRETLAANSRQVDMNLHKANGAKMELRAATGGTSTNPGRITGVGSPYWVKLTRVGNVFTGFVSPDGQVWTQVSQATVTMTANVYIGLMHGSGSTTTSATSTFDNVSIVSLPSPWQSSDVGAVAVPGSAIAAGGVYTITGSGADIYSVSDEFRYMYQSAIGDCDITLRVADVQLTNNYAKAGVMIRETLNTDSMHAMVDITPAGFVEFIRRVATGGTSTSNVAANVAAPAWVRLVRSGNTFTASYSVNGAAWTQLGTATITMSSTVYIGLAVTSHADGTLNSAVLDNATVTP